MVPGISPNFEMLPVSELLVNENEESNWKSHDFFFKSSAVSMTGAWAIFSGRRGGSPIREPGKRI
jgi:hypothetical protein